MIGDEDAFYNMLRHHLKKLTRGNGVKLKRQYPVVHKDKRFRVDFAVICRGKILVIEHDGKYHYNRRQGFKDDERDQRVIAGLIYDFFEGNVKMVHAFYQVDEEFIYEELPKLVEWLLGVDISSGGLDWSVDRKTRKAA